MSVLESRRHSGGQAQQTILPPEDTYALEEITAALAATTPSLVGPDGAHTPIPHEVYAVLVNVVEAMQAGRAISIQPVTTTLTTSEAAQLLGVSRPTLVKLLEDGKIAYSKPNRHRYVLLTDLLEYMNRQNQVRAEILDALVDEGLETGLYDVDPTAATAALIHVRKG